VLKHFFLLIEVILDSIQAIVDDAKMKSEYLSGYGKSPIDSISNSDSEQRKSIFDYTLSFKRKASDVQNEMFDINKTADMSHLQLLLEHKDQELAASSSRMRKLESTLLHMQTRLNDSQTVILSYEAKIEELSTPPPPPTPVQSVRTWILNRIGR